MEPEYGDGFRWSTRKWGDRRLRDAPGTFGRMALSSLHRRYLEILEVDVGSASLPALRCLVRAQVHKVPFENISKLYYWKARGFRGVPSLEVYLDGIEYHGFGGTCYSNNPHFHGLLRALGFEARLYGADMSQPDVHTAISVRLDGRRYHIDTGYAAPFDRPLPQDNDADAEIRLGNERWVLGPADAAGRWQMEHHRDGRLIHGYTVKPSERVPSFFAPAIADSFRPHSTFMKTLRLVRFGDGWSLGIQDYCVIRSTRAGHEIERLDDRNELIAVIADTFGIAPDKTQVALGALGM